MSEYFLNCLYDSRKDFYKKAVVIEEEGVIKLKSYETIVAKIEKNKAVVYNLYSNTTTRHIKEFLKQNGFKVVDNNQILEDYKEGEEDKKKQEEKSNSMFKTIGLVAGLGNIFSNNQKESNDWKLRMLKAGLENKGLMIPNDWDSLTEEEKETRLNKVIDISQEKD